PLPKRQKIERAALEEFAAHGYDGSNLNRIVEGSRIAKGSFYQYFEDKKDLYFHLIETIAQKKLQYLEPALRDYRRHSFAYNMAELFRLAFAFADSDPLLYKIGGDFALRQKAFADEFLENYKPTAFDIYGKLLLRARENGELRDDVNIPLAAAFINVFVSRVSLEFILTENKEQRETMARELIKFVERAVLKP
ncbi:MAG: TetR/AcrR family transcriptional regulator, partial [Gracilibacteraceae bacterium]|nr:TetR/AcrR family transcriptional regulator [Gracilibacteraceae bacterium]